MARGPPWLVAPAEHHNKWPSRPAPLCPRRHASRHTSSGTRARPAAAHLARGSLPGGLALGRGALVGLALAPVGLLLQPLLLLREGRAGWLSGVCEGDASICRAQHLSRL